MIVKMTAELQQKYRDLFAEIAARVSAIDDKASEAEVNSLPTYYRALDYLAEKGKGSDNKKFFRIPLDETPVTIDLNSRKITLGDSFKNNGLGVIGDANAEIVFFECDRFFDVTDLALCNVLIQWSNDGGSTIHQEYGILQDFTDDKYDEDNKLLASAKVLFGWLVSNEVTAKPGNISFNVRFYHKDETTQEVDFNLNTESITIPVKSTLAPSNNQLPTSTDNAEGIIFSRPIYGNIINSMEGATPIITKNLESGVQHLSAQYPSADGSYHLAVEASSPDGGTVVYEWYNNGNIIYTEGKKHSVASYDATVAGTYSVRIGNQTANGTRSLLSPSVHIPNAGDIEIVNQIVPVRAYAPTKESDGRQVPEAMIANMSVSVDHPDVLVNKYPAVLQYSWYKNITKEQYNALVAEELSTKTALEAAPTDEELKKAYDAAAKALAEIVTIGETHYAPIAEANGNTYVPAENAEGIYFCRVVNHLNNTQSKPVLTSLGEVRAYPQNLSAPAINYKDKALHCELRGDNIPANVNEVRYQWFEENTGAIPSRAGGTAASYDLAAYVTKEGKYNYYCKVAHEVYGGTSMAAISEYDAARSDIVTIQVSKVNGVLTYEQIN